MANDRLFIRCNGCRDSILITKHYPGLPMDEKDLERLTVLPDWLRTHYNNEDCNKHLYSNCIESPQFTFESEQTLTEADYSTYLRLRAEERK